ncbi:MAG: hypothetical protein ACRDOF_08400 [Gaiellaceae bacterium]
MQRLREMLAHGGIAVLAIVFALALAMFNLATALAQQVISVLQQNFHDPETGGTLEFRLAGTDIYYGEALLYGLVLALVVGALYTIWRWTRGSVRACPECRSDVPRTASICRFCTSELPESDQ